MQKPTILLASSTLFSAIVIFLFLALPPNVWDEWKPATCLESGCFCEPANFNRPIRQAANTVSSLGFVFSGAFMLAYRRRDLGRLPLVYSYLMGTAALIIGIGSAFYHASLTFVGQFFDVFGMFLLAVFMLVYAFERIWNLRLAATLSLFLTINIFLSGLHIAVPDARRYAFAVVLIVALLFEAHYRKRIRPRIEAERLRLGVALMAIAYIIWILDNTRTLCFEGSLLQGHAVWHLLGALSLWFLYQYYVSEEK